MIKPYQKGSLPDYIGDQSPSPWDLTPCGQKHETRTVQQDTLPHVFVTGFGAQVASQHCLVLRTGQGIVSKLTKMTSKQLLLKFKKWRLKTNFENWIVLARIIHPKLTLKLNKKLS